VELLLLLRGFYGYNYKILYNTNDQLYSFFWGGGGDSPASEFYVSTFRKTLSVPSSYEDGTDSVIKSYKGFL
jgi:hypothetical protein